MPLFFISFFAGVLTVLAPCILPLLPVVIGGSVSGAPRAARAWTITIALGASVFVFTLILKVSTALIDIPPSFWQWLSGGILFVVGVFMLFPSIWDTLVPASMNTVGNRLLGTGNKRGGFWGDVLMGAALGPVFSSCSPTYFILLAAVLPATPVTGLVYLAAYVVGLALALFLIAYAGQRIIDALGWAADPKGWVKRAIGVLFIVLGVLIIFGIDKDIQTALPSWAFGITNVEESILKGTSVGGTDAGTTAGGLAPEVPSGDAATTDETASNNGDSSASYLTLAQKALRYPKAPELVSPDAYLNTNGEPITIAQYRGKKVVLVDFWTYSCINCLRTTPYLTSWYDTYEKDGLVIIGVHTPEFAFEHVKSNVEEAVKRLGIRYPVVLDNEYQTWKAYKNQYWPRKYLVDIDGYIVYDHIGEGEYDQTERAIQKALRERAARLGASGNDIEQVPTVIPSSDAPAVGSPETYFGASRNEYFASGAPNTTGTRTYAVPETPLLNHLYLGGSWDIELENAVAAGGDTSIVYTYNARDVYFVASSKTPLEIEVLRDGKPVGAFAGEDISPTTSKGTIGEERLYKLIHDDTLGVHTLEIRAKKPGLTAYTFTFG